MQLHFWEFKQALGCILVLVLALVKHQTSCKCRDVRGEVAPKSRRRVALELFRKQETFLFLKIQSPFWKGKMCQLALSSSKYVFWYPLPRLLTSATNKSCYLKLLAIVNKCQEESKYVVLYLASSWVVFFPSKLLRITIGLLPLHHGLTCMQKVFDKRSSFHCNGKPSLPTVVVRPRSRLCFK